MTAFIDKLSNEERRIFEEYKSLFTRLDELWEEYEENGLNTLNNWERDKVVLIEKISKLSGLVKRLSEEINELKIKVDVGLLSQEEVEPKLEELRESINEISGKLEALEAAYNELIRRAETHKKRILPAKIRASREELERRLEDLEEKFRRGEISETIYEKLKDEIMSLLKLISTG